MAVGTGSYDGGYFYEGELLILDLRSGLSTSVLRWARELMHVEWAGERALRVLAAPVDSFPGGHYDATAHSYAYSAVLERSDWSDVAGGSVQQEELIGPRVEFQHLTRESVSSRGIAALAALTGTQWEPRRQVWDVQQLPDGRVLACVEGVVAESWLPDGQLQWCIRDEGDGRQLVIRSDQLEAWVNVPWRSRRVGAEWVTEPPLVARVSLEDGRVLDSLRLDSAVTLTTREDGWLALRSTDHERSNGWLALIDPAGETPELQVPLGGFEACNNAFPIRRSRQLLILQGKDHEEPWQDKHVVAVDPTGPDGEPSVRELFPLEWDTARAGQLFGGPGIEVGSAGNRDLVHAKFVHDGAGLLPANVFVVRRSGLYGAVRWVFTADFPATALDGDEDTVYVGFNSGELVALHTSDGTVRWRQHLEVGGQPVVPLSLTLTGPGRLLIGTVDGRILDCSVE
ncbi:hypothetical protein [Nocardia sp. NPDC006630]|uniref:hypothetical protein n=1 Tax=Nocardia sp. NPDC006630 TaxID=3157181 RepID=UPI0033B2CD0C